MYFGSALLSVKSLSERSKQMFWTMNIILCIDFPVRHVEFELWKYVSAGIFCLLLCDQYSEQADKTLRKLFYDEITVKKKLQYMQKDILKV